MKRRWIWPPLRPKWPWPTALTTGRDPGAADLSAVVGEVLLSTPAQSIAGGTDEIQRNIIGERVLGLPGEPRVDKRIPFKDIPR